MDGVHDVGGMHGFGPVEREQDESVFHGAWEAAVVAMMRAGGRRGVYNIDEFRHGIERMDPAHYPASSYYEHWLDGITRIFLEKGVVGAEELAARTEFFRARPRTTARSPSQRASRSSSSCRPSSTTRRSTPGSNARGCETCRSRRRGCLARIRAGRSGSSSGSSGAAIWC